MGDIRDFMPEDGSWLSDVVVSFSEVMQSLSNVHHAIDRCEEITFEEAAYLAIRGWAISLESRIVELSVAAEGLKAKAIYPLERADVASAFPKCHWGMDTGFWILIPRELSGISKVELTFSALLEGGENVVFLTTSSVSS